MKLPHNHEPTPRHSIHLSDLLESCSELTSRHSRSLDPLAILAMKEDDQQALVDAINPHLAFEYAQTPEVHGMLLRITGYGLMFVTDTAGNVLGAETVSHGDIVRGTLREVCAVPVPTMESVGLSTPESTPILGQTISGMLLLDDASYRTGLNASGAYELEHDLGIFKIGIPLNHELEIACDIDMRTSDANY